MRYFQFAGSANLGRSGKLIGLTGLALSWECKPGVNQEYCGVSRTGPVGELGLLARRVVVLRVPFRGVSEQAH